MTTPSVQKLIEKHSLVPNPNGGWFTVDYESYVNAQMFSSIANNALTVWDDQEVRRVASGIKAVATSGQKFPFHFLKGDEIFFWHSGGPLTIIELLPPDETGGRVKEVILGPNEEAGQVYSYVVRGGTCFGFFCPSEHEYVFYSCILSPAFDPA